MPYPEKELGLPKGLISLPSVAQENKRKVCSIIDYWELNRYVDTFTTNADINSHELKEW